MAFGVRCELNPSSATCGVNSGKSLNISYNNFTTVK